MVKTELIHVSYYYTFGKSRRTGRGRPVGDAQSLIYPKTSQMEKISRYIELTNLKPTVTQKEVEALTQSAISGDFFGICVPPYWVKKVARDLKGSDVTLVTVAGFPLGFHMSQTKLAEAARAIEEGAQEVDVVMNLTAFKTDPKGWNKIEVAQLAKLCHSANVVLKMILETAYLSDAEIVLACKICKDAGADFVKTSTGFAPKGAESRVVALMKETVGYAVGVKASGGINTYAQALDMIAAGAERIGTSSGVKIALEEKGSKG